MKKLLAILLALLMVFSLVACGAKEEPPAAKEETKTEAPKEEASAEETPVEEEPASETPAEKIKMSLWMPPYTDGETMDTEFWQKVTAPWAEENNVELSVTIVPWGNYEERFLTGFVSGEGPDVSLMYNEMLFEYVENGMIEPLDSYLTDADRDNYKYLSMGQVSGKQMTMPFTPGGMRVIYYNKDILNDAGITELPDTWQEFIDVCLKIKENNPDMIPYAQEWGTEAIGALNASYYPFMWSAGGDLFNSDGTVALMDNDGAVKAASFVNDLLNTYHIMPEDSMAYQTSDLINLFSQGEMAFVSLPVAYCGSFDDAGIDWGYIPSLVENEGDKWITFGQADALVMNAASVDKDLAWSLIHFITSADTMAQFYDQLSPGPGLTKDAEFAANEKFRELYDATDHLCSLPVAKNSVSLLQALKSNLQLMLMEDMTPEEAIQSSVDYYNSIG